LAEAAIPRRDSTCIIARGPNGQSDHGGEPRTRRACELVQLVLRNDGRLAERKRGRFAELTDEEVAACEAAIAAAREAGTG